MLDGRIHEEGDPSDVINRYIGMVLERQKAHVESEANGASAGSTPKKLTFSHRHGDRAAEIAGVEIYDSKNDPSRTFTTGERMRVRVTCRFHEPQSDPMVGILIRTRTGMDVFGTNTTLEDERAGPCKAGDVLEVDFVFDCWLAPQEYTVTLAVQHPDGHSHDWLDDVRTFRVLDHRRLAGVANLHPKVACKVRQSGASQ